MLPNIPPKVFSLSAVAVGYILIGNNTAREQNAMGNWLMLVAQVLSTNAFYREVMQERGLEPDGSTESGHIKSTNVDPKKDTIAMLEKMIIAIQQEIDELKKTL